MADYCHAVDSTPIWVVLIVAVIGVLGTLGGAFASPLLAARSAEALAKLRQEWESDRQRTEDDFRREDRRRDQTKLLFDTKSAVYAQALELATKRVDTLRKANARLASGDPPALQLPSEDWQSAWAAASARAGLLDPDVLRKMDNWDTWILMDEVDLNRIEPYEVAVDDIAAFGQRNTGKTTTAYNEMVAAMRVSLGVAIPQ